jgi:hypothetical protein
MRVGGQVLHGERKGGALGSRGFFFYNLTAKAESEKEGTKWAAAPSL